MNIILIGLKTSGKTTIGKKLASILNYSFCDIDDLIIQKFNDSAKHSAKTSYDVYQQLGIKEFRILEKKAVLSIGSLKSSIIATGGGTPLDKGNVSLLKQIGKFIYLFLNKDDFILRLKRLDQKSYIKTLPLNEVYAKRHDIYDSISDFVVDVSDKITENSVNTILEVIDSGK